MTQIPHLSGLRDIADQYDYYFLDIFGLLHNGQRLNPGTIVCLETLKNHGKKICLVSNTPKMPEDCIRDLVRYGIERSMYDEIITAGASAHVELSENYRNTKVMFFGSPEFAGPMRGLNIVLADSIDNADFILNSIPGSVQFDEGELLAILHEAKNRNLKMVCANPDLVVHIGEDLIQCAGTYAALYEQIGGEVSYHGKPYKDIYDIARGLLGNPPKDKICALGDALHTDIRGACNYGIDGIWSLTGIHWEELRYDHNPGMPDMTRVIQAMAQSPHKPAATITGFNW